LDTIKTLKTLGVTKVGFTAIGEISYVEMVNEKPVEQIDPNKFKAEMEKLEEETLYYSAN
jgi:hypothetical protein